MNITAIKAQVKNPERLSIFVDGKYSFSLNLDELLKAKLKKGDPLEQQDIDAYKKLSNEGKVRQRTIEWLMRRPHSEKELRDYLFRKKVDADFAGSLISEMKQRQYVNDETFATWFMEQRLRKHKSFKAVANELRSKGVSTVTIQNIASEANPELSDSDSLRILVNKLRKRSRYQDEQKLIRYLLSKGFSYDLVREVLQKELDE